jgi:L-iditol 2-dehydrogenase
LTTQITVPRDSLVAVPEGMTADQAAMLEPLGVCIHAIDLARPRLLESVAVIGCGAIGLGIIQLLRLSGCSQIIAVDPQAHRAHLALSMGADAAGDSVETVQDHTQGLGCHLVIEATNAPRGFADAVESTRIGGRAVLVGIPDGNVYTGLDAASARRRGLSLKFARRMGDVYPRAIQLVSSGKVDVDALVSHHFALPDTPEAFAMQANEAVGLVKSIVRVSE